MKDKKNIMSFCYGLRLKNCQWFHLVRLAKIAFNIEAESRLVLTYSCKVTESHWEPNGQRRRSFHVTPPIIRHWYHTQNQLKGGKKLYGEALSHGHFVQLQETNDHS